MSIYIYTYTHLHEFYRFVSDLIFSLYCVGNFCIPFDRWRDFQDN